MNWKLQRVHLMLMDILPLKFDLHINLLKFDAAKHQERLTHHQSF